eukprot:753696-Pleurochrysis_carterae.AAC.1
MPRRSGLTRVNYSCKGTATAAKKKVTDVQLEEVPSNRNSSKTGQKGPGETAPPRGEEKKSRD